MSTKVSDLNLLSTETLLSNLFNIYCTTSVNLLHVHVYQEFKNIRHALLHVLNVFYQLSIDLNDLNDSDFI